MTPVARAVQAKGTDLLRDTLSILARCLSCDQHVGPKTIFEIVAAAIQEAEKMLRESNNVYEFNAGFKRSRGLPSLLQKSQCLDPDNVISWRDNEYQKAKEAIEPSGDGLGRGFIQHFLPKNSVANNNTLQAAITAYYQEQWRQEGEKLLDESQQALTPAKCSRMLHSV